MQQQLTIVAGQDQPRSQLGFFAHGLLVENITNQWYYHPGARRFIPPYYGGVMMPLAGVQQAELTCQAPQGTVQATPRAGEFVSATWFDQVLPASAGVNTQYVQSKPSYYDRPGAIGISLLYMTTLVAPHNGTQRWSYTVPARRAAYFEVLNCTIMRDGAPTTAGQAYIDIRYTPAGTGQLGRLAFLIEVQAAVGQPRYTQFGGQGLLLPGDLIAAVTSDASVAGTYIYEVGAKLTEFDL